MSRTERVISTIALTFLVLCAIEGVALTAWITYLAEHESPILIPPCATQGGK